MTDVEAALKDVHKSLREGPTHGSEPHPSALAELSDAEFDAVMEEFARGSEHAPPLPPDFSRADIYSDHD
jgi:hypothetical protein